MPQVMPGTGVLVSIEYPANGLDWARLYDNRLSGWRVGDAGTIEPEPVIIGSLPLPATNTSPVLLPQWGFLAIPGAQVAGVLFHPAVLPPLLHQWRGSRDDLPDPSCDEQRRPSPTRRALRHLVGGL